MLLLLIDFLVFIGRRSLLPLVLMAQAVQIPMIAAQRETRSLSCGCLAWSWLHLHLRLQLGVSRGHGLISICTHICQRFKVHIRWSEAIRIALLACMHVFSI